MSLDSTMSASHEELFTDETGVLKAVARAESDVMRSISQKEFAAEVETGQQQASARVESDTTQSTQYSRFEAEAYAEVQISVRRDGKTKLCQLRTVAVDKALSTGDLSSSDLSGRDFKLQLHNGERGILICEVREESGIFYAESQGRTTKSVQINHEGLSYPVEDGKEMLLAVEKEPVPQIPLHYVKIQSTQEAQQEKEKAIETSQKLGILTMTAIQGSRTKAKRSAESSSKASSILRLPCSRSHKERPTDLSRTWNRHKLLPTSKALKAGHEDLKTERFTIKKVMATKCMRHKFEELPEPAPRQRISVLQSAPCQSPQSCSVSLPEIQRPAFCLSDAKRTSKLESVPQNYLCFLEQMAIGSICKVQTVSITQPTASRPIIWQLPPSKWTSQNGGIIGTKLRLLEVLSVVDQMKAMEVSMKEQKTMDWKSYPAHERGSLPLGTRNKYYAVKTVDAGQSSASWPHILARATASAEISPSIGDGARSDSLMAGAGSTDKPRPASIGAEAKAGVIFPQGTGGGSLEGETSTPLASTEISPRIGDGARSDSLMAGGASKDKPRPASIGAEAKAGVLIFPQETGGGSQEGETSTPLASTEISPRIGDGARSDSLMAGGASKDKPRPASIGAEAKAGVLIFPQEIGGGSQEGETSTPLASTEISPRIGDGARSDSLMAGGASKDKPRPASIGAEAKAGVLIFPQETGGGSQEGETSTPLASTEISPRIGDGARSDSLMAGGASKDKPRPASIGAEAKAGVIFPQGTGGGSLGETRNRQEITAPHIMSGNDSMEQKAQSDIGAEKIPREELEAVLSRDGCSLLSEDGALHVNAQSVAESSPPFKPLQLDYLPMVRAGAKAKIHVLPGGKIGVTDFLEPKWTAADKESEKGDQEVDQDIPSNKSKSTARAKSESGIGKAEQFSSSSPDLTFSMEEVWTDRRSKWSDEARSEPVGGDQKKRADRKLEQEEMLKDLSKKWLHCYTDDRLSAEEDQTEYSQCSPEETLLGVASSESIITLSDSEKITARSFVVVTRQRSRSEPPSLSLPATPPPLGNFKIEYNQGDLLMAVAHAAQGIKGTQTEELNKSKSESSFRVEYDKKDQVIRMRQEAGHQIGVHHSTHSDKSFQTDAASSLPFHP